ncbi:MAG: hypothetical protein JKY37_31270 [Nannocystaceae bacterium]|nr:hypothetical protein [Nannocystaceae bacterium]
MADYNYTVFEMAREQAPFDAFKRGLFVGDRAPSFPLENATTGEVVEISSLWARGPAVLEFGSLT